jgi:hypothetical protein
MKRFRLSILLLGIACQTALAQTEEPIHYKITVPAGADLTLDGTLTLPADLKKPVPVVLLIAGSGPTDRDCNSSYGLKSNAFKMLADSLVRNSIAVARYDKRGSGTNLADAAKVLKSEEHRFSFYVSDALGFIRQLQTDKRFSKVFVAGHSEGSLVGMLAAEEAKANGFVSIAGPGRSIAEVMKEQGRTAGNPQDLQAEVDGALDSLRNGYTIQPKNPILKAQLPPKAQPGLISWMKYDPAVVIKEFHGPVLILQGKKDLQVSVRDAELLKAACPNASMVFFEQMNHVLKDVSGTDKTENFRTYNNPALPLTPGLSTTIAGFVKK